MSMCTRLILETGIIIETRLLIRMMKFDLTKEADLVVANLCEHVK